MSSTWDIMTSYLHHHYHLYVQHRCGPSGGHPQEVEPLVMSQVDGEPGQQPQQPLLLRLSDDPATDQAGDQEPCEDKHWGQALKCLVSKSLLPHKQPVMAEAL